MGELVQFSKSKRQPKPKFREGQTVLLKGGSCEMTVTDVLEVERKGKVSFAYLCEWHDAHDAPQEKPYPQRSLFLKGDPGYTVKPVAVGSARKPIKKTAKKPTIVFTPDFK